LAGGRQAALLSVTQTMLHPRAAPTPCNAADLFWQGSPAVKDTLA
jgi:hypothetical protein